MTVIIELPGFSVDTVLNSIATLQVIADIHCVYMADEATNGNPQGGETEAGSEPTSPSLEDLQRQLAEMEAEQSELAIRLQQQTDLVEPQLDSHLAVIEEQFRENFDDRLREAAPPASGIGRRLDAAGTGDVLLINRVFREVSRCMGDEWMPVFDALMSSLPQEVIEQAKNSLQQHPPLIQGYRALLAWREAAGREFEIRRLVDVLRSCSMDDVADVAVSLLDDRDGKEQKPKQTQPIQRRKSDLSAKSKTDILDNRRILLLAKKVGGDWEPLGKALGVPEDEIAEIKESADASTYQGAFKMLWAWRQSQTTGDDAMQEALRSALQQVDKAQLIEEIAAK